MARHRELGRRRFLGGTALVAVVLCAAGAGVATARDLTEAKVAVAANFTEPAKEIGALFEKASGDKITLSFGATGQFYAQIVQGAPFDILVSADQATPTKAIAEGHGIAGTQSTYAVGKLVLFSKDKALVAGEAALKAGNFQKISIANPEIAPYGAAAVETMKSLGVYDALKPKIVQGNSIAQAFQFVDTGNAEIGFVALSQVIKSEQGTRWVVPATLYKAIAQDVVLLKPGADNAAAKAFLAFLKGPEATAIIEKYGYGSATR